MVPSRRPSATNSSNARTSGSSWDMDAKTRSSTNPTSQLSSRPVSLDAKATLQPRHRASSVSVTGTSPGKSFPPRHIGPGGITLPLNNSVSQLATLSHSAHTLSPYARGHEHIAVRSFPHLGKTALSGGSSSSTNLSAIAEGAHGAHGPVKARRKRIFHINKSSPEKKEVLSPDIDDEVFHGSMTPSPEHEWSSRERSRSPTGMTPMVDGRSRRPVSLTGVAQRFMAGSGPGVRPNYGRAPASRSSYGFPAVSGTRL
jgi:distribution and morphology protein 34